MKFLTSRPYYRKESWGGAGPQTRGGEGRLSVRLSVLSFQTDFHLLRAFPSSNKALQPRAPNVFCSVLSQTTNLNFRSELRISLSDGWACLSGPLLHSLCPQQGHTIHNQLSLVTIRHFKIYLLQKWGSYSTCRGLQFNSQHPSQMPHNHQYLQLQGTGYLWNSQTCRQTHAEYTQTVCVYTHTRLKIKRTKVAIHYFI